MTCDIQTEEFQFVQLYVDANVAFYEYDLIKYLIETYVKSMFLSYPFFF